MRKLGWAILVLMFLLISCAPQTSYESTPLAAPKVPYLEPGKSVLIVQPEPAFF